MPNKKGYNKKKRNHLAKAHKSSDIPQTAKPVTQSIKEEPPTNKSAVPFHKTWKVIGRIAIIATIAAVGIQIYESYFKSDRKKFEEENIIPGEIKSPKVSQSQFLKEPPNFYYDLKNYKLPPVKGIYIKNLSKTFLLSFQMGGTTVICPTIDLLQGINILYSISNGCTNAVLGLVAKDDRLYVSAKFIDFQTEDEIGEMAFNHWKLYKHTFLDYRYADDRFEVKDKRGNIVFSIKFTESKPYPFVTITGYFVDPNSVFILNDQKNPFTAKTVDSLHRIKKDTSWVVPCISKINPYWKRNAEIEMMKIKSVF